MKNKIVIALLLSFVFIGLVGCGKKKDSFHEIVLMTNGGVPYKWEYEIKNKSIVSFDHMNSVNQNPGAEGGRVEEHYYFKALKSGSTTIKFTYRDFRDGTIQKEKEYNVVVDNELNMTITEK